MFRINYYGNNSESSESPFGPKEWFSFECEIGGFLGNHIRVYYLWNKDEKWWKCRSQNPETNYSVFSETNGNPKAPLLCPHCAPSCFKVLSTQNSKKKKYN